MVVNDLPSVRKTLPHQREYSSNVIFFPPQMPMPQNQRRVRPQKPKLQIREIKLPHRRAIRIILLVPRQHPIPAARHAAASRKRQFRRTPVPRQKSIHVSAVPCGLLGCKDRGDRLPVSTVFRRGLGGCQPVNEYENTDGKRTCQKCPATSRPHSQAPL